MKQCCVDKLKECEELLRTGKELKVALVASPFVLLIGDSSGPVEMLGNLLKDMAIEKAIEKISHTKKALLVEAFEGIDPIIHERIRTVAQLHYLDHLKDYREMLFWERLYAIYK